MFHEEENKRNFINTNFSVHINKFFVCLFVCLFHSSIEFHLKFCIDWDLGDGVCKFQNELFLISLLRYS